MGKIIKFFSGLPFAILLLSIMGTMLIANPTLPPSRRTGAPGDLGTCNDSGCHATFQVVGNSGSLTIDVSSIPGTGYVPTETYSITVDLSAASTPIYGFELTVLADAAGNAFAGDLTAVGNTLVQTSSGKEYISHFNPSTSGIWTFNWQAPLAGTGSVTFYAAGNAANNNGANTGDVIHTKSVTVSQAVIDDVDDGDVITPFDFRIRDNYPNPFNPSTTIRYEVDRTGPFSLKIYDVLGREVKTLVNAQRTPGSYEITWDATNNHGVSVASGTYIARIQSGTKVATSRLLLIK